MMELSWTTWAETRSLGLRWGKNHSLCIYIVKENAGKATKERKASKKKGRGCSINENKWNWKARNAEKNFCSEMFSELEETCKNKNNVSSGFLARRWQWSSEAGRENQGLWLKIRDSKCETFLKDFSAETNKIRKLKNYLRDKSEDMLECFLRYRYVAVFLEACPERLVENKKGTSQASL